MTLLDSVQKLVAASRPILSEARQRLDFNQADLNPDYHVELTLSVAELQALDRAAMIGTAMLRRPRR